VFLIIAMLVYCFAYGSADVIQYNSHYRVGGVW